MSKPNLISMLAVAGGLSFAAPALATPAVQCGGASYSRPTNIELPYSSPVSAAPKKAKKTKVAANPCAANPCSAKSNPCAANPCAANPCAANPCAANRCSAKKPK